MPSKQSEPSLAAALGRTHLWAIFISHPQSREIAKGRSTLDSGIGVYPKKTKTSSP